MSGNNPLMTSDLASAGRANALNDGLRQAENTASKVRQAQNTASNLHQAQNLTGNIPNTGNLGKMGNVGKTGNLPGSNIAGNVTSDLRSRGVDTAEALREQTYGHSSGYGGHNRDFDQDMNTNYDNNVSDLGKTRSSMPQQSMSGAHGTQMGSGMRDESRNFSSMPQPHTGMNQPSMSGMQSPGMGESELPHHPRQVAGETVHAGRTFATRTGINSGAGIHAQQFHGPESAADYGTTTTRYVSDIGDNRQIPSTLPAASDLSQGRGSNIHATEHGHPMGQGKHHGCAICTTASEGVTQAPTEHGHPLGQGEALGCQTCIARSTASQAAGNSKVETTKDTKTYEGPSKFNLQPGEVVIEEETRIHRGVFSPGGTTTTTTTRSQRGGSGASMDSSTRKSSLKDKLLGKHSVDDHHATGGVTHARN